METFHKTQKHLFHFFRGKNYHLFYFLRDNYSVFEEAKYYLNYYNIAI